MRVALETERVGEQKKRQKGEKRKEKKETTKRGETQNKTIKIFSVTTHFSCLPLCLYYSVVRTHLVRGPTIPSRLSRSILAFPKVKISDSRASVSKPPLRYDCCVTFVFITDTDGGG